MLKIVEKCEIIPKIIALILGLALCVVGFIELYFLGTELIQFNTKMALSHGLFIVVILELFFVIKSYIKYTSVNIALVINVCIVAIMKQILFDIEKITLPNAVGFATILISLGLLYIVESYTFDKKKEK